MKILSNITEDGEKIIYIETEIDFNNWPMKIVTYRNDDNEEQLILEHKENINHPERVFERTLNHHKEVVEADWFTNVEVKERSKEWLKKYASENK